MLIILLRILNYLMLSHNIGKEKPWQELSDVFFFPLFLKEGVGNEHSKVELTFID
jgi:hypothetical protein